MVAPWGDSSTSATAAAAAVKTSTDSGAGHWAFAALRPIALPTVKNRAWVRSAVDAFVPARLEWEGIAPSAPADRRTLIRRATLDLLGIPPTAAEIDAFAADPAPDAFARVVDRLPASPRYGERWGRHWLDVARYADTKGSVFTAERKYPAHGTKMMDGALEGVRHRRAAQDRSPPRTGSCLSTAAVSGTRAARGFRWSDHHFRSMSR